MTGSGLDDITSLAEITALASAALTDCGAAPLAPGGSIPAQTPITGGVLGAVPTSGPDVDRAVERAVDAFGQWRTVPGPQRGELIRQFGALLRANKVALARLVQVEVGKIESEALGEVQEMIDICDFAVGLSRQLHGLTIASERPGHRLMEQWHPLGPVAVISAFNFPVAVWSWNAALAIVCGNPVTSGFGQTVFRGRAAPGAGDLSVPDEINYTAGLTAAVSPRVTLSLDAIGRSVRDANRFDLVPQRFTYNTAAGGPFQAERADAVGITGRENIHILLGVAGVKINVAKTLLLTANVLFPLNDSGLRAKISPVVGLDYAF